MNTIAHGSFYDPKPEDCVCLECGGTTHPSGMRPSGICSGCADKPSCATCRYFVEGSGRERSFCFRFLVTVSVTKSNWCGEFKPKGGAA